MTQRAWTAPQMMAIIDSAPDAMLIIDRSGTIVFANRQTEILFGWDPEELTGEAIEVLVPEPFPATHVAQRDSYCENPHVRPMGAGLELSAVCRDGSAFPVEISLSPLETDEGLFVVSSIRNATAYKRAARERMATIVDHAPLCVTEM